MKGHQTTLTHFIDNCADAANCINGNPTTDNKCTLLSSSIYADWFTDVNEEISFAKVSLSFYGNVNEQRLKFIKQEKFLKGPIVHQYINNRVELREQDKGHGIPMLFIEKTFQSFFTSKPTGSGIGLGLSLNYDFIKAYGSEIKVDSQDGKRTAFTMSMI